MSRPDTPDMKNDDGSTTITVKRACNGCHREIGDATHVEIDAAMYGRPLPDVRAECGCEPTAAATNQDPQQDRRHGMDVRVCASESRPAARADLTGSQTIRPQERTAVGQVAHAWTDGAPEPARPVVAVTGGVEPDEGDLLYDAWALIANGRDWHTGDDGAEWRQAAIRWRDRWHATLPGGDAPTCSRCHRTCAQTWVRTPDDSAACYDCATDDEWTTAVGCRHD